jgi:Na+-driven multidrug efflux pump
MRVEHFILIPIFSFNVGLATFTGQNVGAGKLDRVRTGLKVTQIMGCIVCAAVAVLAYLAAFPLVGMFGVEGETQALGVQYIHFIAPWLLVFCVYIITNGVLQGAGDVMFTAANTISSLLIRCVGAYFLAYFTPVAGTAAWVSLPIGWVWSLVLALCRYKWGPWRKKAVTTAQPAGAEGV